MDLSPSADPRHDLSGTASPDCREKARGGGARGGVCLGRQSYGSPKRVVSGDGIDNDLAHQ